MMPNCVDFSVSFSDGLSLAISNTTNRPLTFARLFVNDHRCDDLMQQQSGLGVIPVLFWRTSASCHSTMSSPS